MESVRESSKTPSKTVAKLAEAKRRRELEEGYNNLGDGRNQRVQTIREVAEAYLEAYKLKHRAIAFAEYAVAHVVRHLGERMLVDVNDKTVKAFQVARLKEGAAGKTVNEEVGFLLRFLGDTGDSIRTRLRKKRELKIAVCQNVGKAYSDEEKARLLEAAWTSKSPRIYPALCLALNAGLRDAEIRNLQLGNIHLDEQFLVVGKSKTEAGEGRTIPLNASLLMALSDYLRWYADQFGPLNPQWYLLPFGRPGHLDPTRPMTTLKTAWGTVRDRAGVAGRWHDARHTLITELAETGAGDQTIMDIAGHVSRQMLARYSHIRMEAKRKALAAVGTKLQPVAATGTDG
jgi:integrase